MQSAIVSGATGLVGSAVVRHMLDQDVEVLALGRRHLDSKEVEGFFGAEVPYLSIPQGEINRIESALQAIEWSPVKDCVFYNFAWSGRNGLTDGSLEMQLGNATNAANTLKVAKALGCNRFVNAGTLEETVMGRWIREEATAPYRSSQANYALAKLTSRDLCVITAYLQKLDYVHTRLSVPLNFSLSGGNYVASALRKIAAGKMYEAPQNSALFDIVSTRDVARAYFLLGSRGVRNGDYYIGTSRPTTLTQYFKYFAEAKSGHHESKLNLASGESAEIFDTTQLRKDTGFSPEDNFEDLLKYLER
jgi:nucleoside-diphosphate-sugar epimerase